MNGIALFPRKYQTYCDRIVNDELTDLSLATSLSDSDYMIKTPRRMPNTFID